NFGLYLAPDSPANEWYIDTGSQTVVWAKFETRFRTRFPRIQKAKKTPAELQREMLDLVWRVEDLDKTLLYGGIKVKMYKVHAKKLLKLAKQAKIDAGIPNMVFV
ncbi:hypothetical protein L208DRAFT_1234943, partial [Tricholoma matsutake]